MQHLCPETCFESSVIRSRFKSLDVILSRENSLRERWMFKPYDQNFCLLVSFSVAVVRRRFLCGAGSGCNVWCRVGDTCVDSLDVARRDGAIKAFSAGGCMNAEFVHKFHMKCFAVFVSVASSSSYLEEAGRWYQPVRDFDPTTSGLLAKKLNFPPRNLFKILKLLCHLFWKFTLKHVDSWVQV